MRERGGERERERKRGMEEGERGWNLNNGEERDTRGGRAVEGREVEKREKLNGRRTRREQTEGTAAAESDREERSRYHRS